MCIAVRHFACGAKEHFYSPDCTLATCKKQINYVSPPGNCFICAERHKATATPVSIPHPKPSYTPINTPTEAYAVMANADINDARGNNTPDLLTRARALFRHFDYYLSLEPNWAMKEEEGEQGEQMNETENEVNVTATSTSRSRIENGNGNGKDATIATPAKVNNQELEDTISIRADRDAAMSQQEEHQQQEQYDSGKKDEVQRDEEVTPWSNTAAPNPPGVSVSAAENYSSFTAVASSSSSSSSAQPEQQQPPQPHDTPNISTSTSTSTSRRARRLARQRRADVRQSGIWKKPKEN